MNKPALILTLIFFAACQNRSPKNVIVAKMASPIAKTNTNPVPIIPTHNSKGIEGIYIARPLEGDEDSCNMSVEIKKNGTAYSYIFNSNGEILKGTASVVKGHKGDEVYVDFEGIKWAEYEGDISNDMEGQNSTSLALPYGVQGSFVDNDIIIQNSGNAMNYYVKFAGCDKKYIRLVKAK